MITRFKLQRIRSERKSFGLQRNRVKSYDVTDIVCGMLSRPSPEGVFLSMPFSDKDLEILLDNVRLHVALMRMGDIQLQPGPHCTFCEHDGLTNCVPRLE